MLKLGIKNIDGYDYLFIDKYNKEYMVNLSFYDLDIDPQVGDIIYINEKLLNDIRDQVVSFGTLDSIEGKDIENDEDKEIIIIEKDNKRYYLKRIYG